MKTATRPIGFTTLIGLTGALLGAAPAEVRMPTRTVEDQGHQVRLDLGRQVLGISIPDDRGFGEQGKVETPIAPTLRDLGGGFVSGSMLAQKAKQFDDGLYAAVELAAQSGAGRFGGKSALLQAVARHLTENGLSPSGNSAAILFAACRLGNVPAPVPSSLEPAVTAGVKDFLGDPTRSKPIGFYPWSSALSDIFRQDRMLQSELKGRPGIEALTRALHADPPARASYDAYSTLVSRLTNPLVGADLRPLLKELDQGRLAAPDDGVAFFPPSRARETDLIKKLYGDRPIPEGFSLVDEMVRRIRDGRMDLRPSGRSGWYDHQTWALEPLVIPERMPEASRLQLDESYRKQLLELFKGVLALTRETHVKQLEFPAPGAAPFNPDKPKVVIHVAPELTAEPLATHYLRRAQSYRFIHNVLDEAFGADAVRGMNRLTASGPVALDLAAELDQMEALCQGACVTVSRQLGMVPEAVSGRSADADAEAFRKWGAGLPGDPDLGKDARMMVPVFYDVLRKKSKVWVFLGWAERPVLIRFAQPPTVAEVLKNGRKVERNPPEIAFTETWQRLAYPVTAEVYVSDILDRDEFRRHCDQYKTRPAILKNLR